MIVRKLLYFILALSCLQGFAAWSPEARRLEKQFYFPIKNTFASTLKGICTPPAKNELIRPTKLKVGSELFEKGYLTVKINFLKDKKREGILKAPLMVFVPGAFNNLGDKQARRMTNSFSKLGYHTLVVPNPWGLDFIKAKMKKPFGTVTAEGRALNHIITNAIVYLRSKNLIQGKVHISGISYGGFMSAMIKALDQRRPKPFIRGTATAISPPINLEKTLFELDYNIRKAASYLPKSRLSTYIKFKNFCKKSIWSYSDQDLRDAQGIVIAEGFHGEIVKSSKKYNSLWKLNAIPEDDNKWEQSFNFTKFFEQFNPSGRVILSLPEGNLKYWMSLIESREPNGVRVLMSKDDFLNLSPLRKRRNVMVLPTGGHYGIRHLAWFEKLLEVAFKP